MKKIVWLVVLVIVLIGGWWIYQISTKPELPDGITYSNGRLELKRYDIASLYPGKVTNVLVQEGNEVTEGEVLVELSSATSNGQLDAAKAQKKRAQEAVQRAEAEIKAYQQQQRVAQMELGNAQALKRDDLVSSAEVSKRLAARNGASASVEAARAAKAEAQAAVAAAQAQIDQAASVNDDMTIRAPLAGRVEYTIVEMGSVIAAGTKVVSLLDPNDVSMNIFLRNKEMAVLKVGDEARIVLDGIDAVLPAHISFIATEAQFTPKSVETQSERENLVFKVKLKLDDNVAQKMKGLLKGGLTGNGYVKTSKVEWPENLKVNLPSSSQ